jgi:hypothetical protein
MLDLSRDREADTTNAELWVAVAPTADFKFSLLDDRDGGIADLPLLDAKAG